MELTYCYFHVLLVINFGLGCLSGGCLPSSRLMAMCRGMGSPFHAWVDYYGVFIRVTRLGLQSF